MEIDHEQPDTGITGGGFQPMIKLIQPEAQVIGIDRDLEILSIAHKKGSRSILSGQKP